MTDKASCAAMGVIGMVFGFFLPAASPVVLITMSMVLLMFSFTNDGDGK